MSLRVYSLHSTVYIQSTVNNLQSTYSLPSTIYNLHTVYRLQFTIYGEDLSELSLEISLTVQRVKKLLLKILDTVLNNLD